MTIARLWGCVFVAAAILYAVTANRGAQWQDSGAQQLRFVTGQLTHPLGLVLTHPVQYWTARAAIHLPALEPAFAITLISALTAAIAVANLAVTIWLLTTNAVATAISITALALSHTFWQHATHTETYALVSALLTGEWLCLAAFAVSGGKRYLLLTAFLNGVGLGVHMLAALTTPVIVAVFVWAVRTRKCGLRAAMGGVLLWLAGTAPYSILVLARMVQTGDVAGVIHSAIFGTFASNVLNTHVSLRGIALPVGYVAYNFPGLTIPLAMAGLVIAIRKRDEFTWLRLALLAELLIFSVFVFRYSVVDQYAFFFPVYLLLAVFAAIGLRSVIDLRRPGFSRAIVVLAAVTALWTPLVYVGTAAILRSRGALKSMVGNKPYRDGYRSFFVPWGVGDDHAERLNDEVRALAGKNGLVLLPYNMIGVGVRYAQAVGQIPVSVSLIEVTKVKMDQEAAKWRAELSAALRADKPVILVPQDRDRPDEIIPGLTWKRHGDLYVLAEIAKSPATQPLIDD